MRSGSREIIEALREEIRRLERKPAARTGFAPTGRREVDAALPGGGFPRGALTELCGERGSGKTAIAAAALARAAAAGGLAAFVDGRGELYPPALRALGVPLERLLIVRPGAGDDPARRGLWATEALLASGAFGAVAIDVPVDARAAATEPMLRRIRAAAEAGGAVALWLATGRGVRVPAALRILVERCEAGPRVRVAAARGGPEPARGAGRAFHAA